VRPIHAAQLDKARAGRGPDPGTGAPAHGPGHGGAHHNHRRSLSTEIPLGSANGLDHACVVSCDNIVTVPKSALRRQIGYLLPAQEAALTAAIHAAFDLD
jgi:mRNA interferase MazF